MSDVYLFVGGPFDGERKAMRCWGDVFQANVCDDMSLNHAPIGKEELEPLTVTRITYVPVTLYGTRLYAPESMRREQMIELLANRYSKQEEGTPEFKRRAKRLMRECVDMLIEAEKHVIDSGVRLRLTMLIHALWMFLR